MLIFYLNLVNLNMASKKSRIVQTKNPRTGKYVKIDRGKGKIVTTKRSDGPNTPLQYQRLSQKFENTHCWGLLKFVCFTAGIW